MRHDTRNRAGSAGFTLTELLVVIAVIGILAGLIFGAVPKVMERAKTNSTRALIHSIDVGLEAFKTDFGHLPYNSSGNVTDDGQVIRLWLLGIDNNGEPDTADASDVRENQFWDGPYVDVKVDKHVDQNNNYVFMDAWREPLCFEMPDAANDPPIFNIDRWDIWSKGPDLKGDTDMKTYYQSYSTFKERRKEFKAAADNGDTVGNW